MLEKKKCMELSDLAFEIEAQAVPGEIFVYSIKY